MATYNNIFKITHTNLLPAQGSILISEPFDGESFWKNSLEQLGSNYEAWTKYPKDPYLN